MVDTDKKYVPPAKYAPKKFNPNKKPEKVRGFTALSFLTLIAIYAGKYCIDFLLLPAIFPNYNTPPIAVTFWIIETIIITFLCIKFVTGFGYFYIPACLIYAVLVWIWPNGIRFRCCHTGRCRRRNRLCRQSNYRANRNVAFHFDWFR
ncbi:hypothetical protein IKG13_03900 [Candidatus Saccharibacteria bacterium]|nr:hypothetical protein [Candidatus Saccharibacteria bacterium]MBR3378081.1 hypothetical protein [Candidatus Saccharibacteria bacterium]